MLRLLKAPSITLLLQSQDPRVNLEKESCIRLHKKIW